MTGRVVTLGETMGLFRATSLGSIAQVSDFHLGIGGAESNVAVALARLGASVTWLGRIGADGLGDRILRELRGEGIDVQAIRDPAPTGLMVKEQRTSTATRVAYYRRDSAGSHLATSDLAAARIGSAAVLHVTGITPALSETAADAVRSAIADAVDAGVAVSFDVNHRGSLWGERNAASVYRELAASATILFAGEDEARLIAPDADGAEQLATAIAALGPREVVIKRGAAGCLALIDGTVHVRAAVPIHPVDTVGAGDAFVAGYLAERLLGLPADARLATAVAMGAFACLNPGDWEGYPRRDELGLLHAEEPVTR